MKKLYCNKCKKEVREVEIAAFSLGSVEVEDDKLYFNFEHDVNEIEMRHNRCGGVVDFMEIKNNLCPICNENELLEEGANALSRKDNETEICSDCGMKEAFEELN